MEERYAETAVEPAGWSMIGKASPSRGIVAVACCCSDWDLSLSDVAVVAACGLWSVLCVLYFAYQLPHAFINERWPSVTTLFLALLNAYPSFMSLLSYHFYKRKSVVTKGLSEDAFDGTRRVLEFVATIAACDYIAYCIAYFIVAITYKSHLGCAADWIVNLILLLTLIAWLVVSVLLWPRSSARQLLAIKYEGSQGPHTLPAGGYYSGSETLRQDYLDHDQQWYSGNLLDTDKDKGSNKAASFFYKQHGPSDSFSGAAVSHHYYGVEFEGDQSAPPPPTLSSFPMSSATVTPQLLGQPSTAAAEPSPLTAQMGSTSSAPPPQQRGLASSVELESYRLYGK